MDGTEDAQGDSARPAMASFVMNHIYTYTHTYTHICMIVRDQLWLCNESLSVMSLIPTHTHTHTHTHTPSHTQTQTHTLTHTHTHPHTYIQTDRHTHILTPSTPCIPPPLPHTPSACCPPPSLCTARQTAPGSKGPFSAPAHTGARVHKYRKCVGGG